MLFSKFWLDVFVWATIIFNPGKNITYFQNSDLSSKVTESSESYVKLIMLNYDQNPMFLSEIATI